MSDQVGWVIFADRLDRCLFTTIGQAGQSMFCSIVISMCISTQHKCWNNVIKNKKNKVKGESLMAMIN